SLVGQESQRQGLDAISSDADAHVPSARARNASADLLAPDTPPNAPAPNNTLDVSQSNALPSRHADRLPRPNSPAPRRSQGAARGPLRHAEAVEQLRHRS